AIRERARQLGFDADRTPLAGFGLGATVAARMGLDDALARRAGLDRSRFRGVLAMRGTYDLSDSAIDGHPDHDRITRGFADAAARASASPIAFARADAPPFIVIAAANDPPAWAQIGRTFALALVRAGAPSVARYVVPGRDGRGLLDLAEDEAF